MSLILLTFISGLSLEVSKNTSSKFLEVFIKISAQKKKEDVNSYYYK